MSSKHLAYSSYTTLGHLKYPNLINDFGLVDFTFSKFRSSQCC